MSRQLRRGAFLYGPQPAHYRVVIVLFSPGVAGNPPPLRIIHVGRVRLSRVVVDGTDDYAANPRQRRAQRSPFKSAGVIAGLHIFHLSGAAGVDPFSKAIQFVELMDWRNAGQFEAGIDSCLFHQVCDLTV